MMLDKQLQVAQTMLPDCRSTLSHSAGCCPLRLDALTPSFYQMLRRMLVTWHAKAQWPCSCSKIARSVGKNDSQSGRGAPIDVGELTIAKNIAFENH